MVAWEKIKHFVTSVIYKAFHDLTVRAIGFVVLVAFCAVAAYWAEVTSLYMRLAKSHEYKSRIVVLVAHLAGDDSDGSYTNKLIDALNSSDAVRAILLNNTLEVKNDSIDRHEAQDSLSAKAQLELNASDADIILFGKFDKNTRAISCLLKRDGKNRTASTLEIRDSNGNVAFGNTSLMVQELVIIGYINFLSDYVNRWQDEEQKTGRQTLSLTAKLVRFAESIWNTDKSINAPVVQIRDKMFGIMRLVGNFPAWQQSKAFAVMAAAQGILADQTHDQALQADALAYEVEAMRVIENVDVSKEWRHAVYSGLATRYYSTGLAGDNVDQLKEAARLYNACWSDLSTDSGSEQNITARLGEVETYVALISLAPEDRDAEAWFNSLTKPVTEFKNVPLSQDASKWMLYRVAQVITNCIQGSFRDKGHSKEHFSKALAFCDELERESPSIKNKVLAFSVYQYKAWAEAGLSTSYSSNEPETAAHLLTAIDSMDKCKTLVGSNELFIKLPMQKIQAGIYLHILGAGVFPFRVLYDAEAFTKDRLSEINYRSYPELWCEFVILRSFSLARLSDYYSHGDKFLQNIFLDWHNYGEALLEFNRLKPVFNTVKLTRHNVSYLKFYPFLMGYLAELDSSSAGTALGYEAIPAYENMVATLYQLNMPAEAVVNKLYLAELMFTLSKRQNCSRKTDMIAGVRRYCAEILSENQLIVDEQTRSRAQTVLNKLESQHPKPIHVAWKGAFCFG